MGKMSVRVGPAVIEIEIEGDDFGKALSDATSAVEKISHLSLRSDHKPSLLGDSAPEQKDFNSTTIEAGINTFVARLGGKSGREILKAAAAHITLVEGASTFSSDQWKKRAKEARDWQAGYAKLQARDMKRMIDQGEINEKGADMYALPTKTLDDVRRVMSGV